MLLFVPHLHSKSVNVAQRNRRASDEAGYEIET